VKKKKNGGNEKKVNKTAWGGARKMSGIFPQWGGRGKITSWGNTRGGVVDRYHSETAKRRGEFENVGTGVRQMRRNTESCPFGVLRQEQKT